MTSRALFAVFCVSSLAITGCRMADGPMPAADKDVPGRLMDISADLQNITAGHADATKDLSDDLQVFVDVGEKPEAVAAIDELSRRVAAGLGRIEVDEAGRQRVAKQLWLAVAAQEYSDKQLENLQADLHSAMLSVKATEQSAQAVASQALAVQEKVRNRQRAWYEIF
jgi:hypothetical protein